MQKNRFVHEDIKAVCNSATKKLVALGLVGGIGGTGTAMNHMETTAMPKKTIGQQDTEQTLTISPVALFAYFAELIKSSFTPKNLANYIRQMINLKQYVQPSSVDDLLQRCAEHEHIDVEVVNLFVQIMTLMPNLWNDFLTNEGLFNQWLTGDASLTDYLEEAATDLGLQNSLMPRYRSLAERVRANNHTYNDDILNDFIDIVTCGTKQPSIERSEITIPPIALLLCASYLTEGTYDVFEFDGDVRTWLHMRDIEHGDISQDSISAVLNLLDQIKRHFDTIDNFDAEGINLFMQIVASVPANLAEVSRLSDIPDSTLWFTTTISPVDYLRNESLRAVSTLTQQVENIQNNNLSASVVSRTISLRDSISSRYCSLIERIQANQGNVNDDILNEFIQLRQYEYENIRQVRNDISQIQDLVINEAEEQISQEILEEQVSNETERTRNRLQPTIQLSSNVSDILSSYSHRNIINRFANQNETGDEMKEERENHNTTNSHAGGFLSMINPFNWFASCRCSK